MEYIAYSEIIKSYNALFIKLKKRFTGSFYLKGGI